MLRWTAQELNWYADAEANSDYFDRLAEQLCGLLPNGVPLHDIGCGNGALAVRLAGRGRQVVAVEQTPAAADTVRQRAQAEQLPIQVFCADYRSLTGQVEYPIFCLVGSLPENMPLLQQWNSKQAVVITLDDRVLPFRIQPTARRGICSQETEGYLTQSGCQYQKICITAAFGQPFADRAAAVDFASYHNPSATAEQIEAYLKQMLHTNTTDASQNYYYLPNPKRVTIFNILLSE